MRSRSNSGQWFKITQDIHTGRAVYVAKAYEAFFKKLKGQYVGNYQLTELWRGIIRLNANATNGVALNPSHSARQLVLNGVAIEYYLDNGDVIISRLKYDARYNASVADQQTGVYKTEYIDEQWKVKPKKQQILDLNHQWSGKHYAAVNGKFPRKDIAGRQLIKHITKAYHLTEYDTEKNDNHYSLYWINKNEHNNQNSIDTLAALIQQAANNKSKVNWLVHGKGAKTFAQAVQHFKTTAPFLKPEPAGLTQTAQNQLRAEENPMALQKVFFSNPVGVSGKELEACCHQSGLSFAGVNFNNRNLFNRNTYLNTKKEIATLACQTLIGGGGGAALHFSGMTSLGKAADAVGKASAAGMGSSMAQAAMIAGTIGLLIIKGNDVKNKLSGAYRAVASMGACSFGTGDQHWFENDEALIDAL